MSRTALRRAASAAVLTLALSGFAACGGDDESADDPAPETTSSASDESSDEPTEKTTDAAPTAGEEIDSAELLGIFAGAFEKATTATFAMSTGGAAGYQATGKADFATVPPAMQMSIEVDQLPEPIELIIVDNTLYQSNPGSGGKFVATPLDDPSSTFGDLSGQLDIRSQFDAMQEAVTTATYVGEEDGLKHYSLLMDSKVLLEGQGADTNMLPQGSVPPAVTFDLWFDGDGYFRKMVTDLGDVGGNMTATYDNWGEPVDISAPPASQIQ
ncbi:MAG: hypothetical protein Q8O61_16985 [Nocardioides sp.]|nr:hypothetical protein [Nocardioides sp.]